MFRHCGILKKNYFNTVYIFLFIGWGRHGRHCMVVGYVTTCAISAYHHRCCEFELRSGEVYSIQHYVIKFVSHLRQVCGFFSRFSSTNKTDCHDMTEIVDSGVNNPNPLL